ncbi:hypothetical protein TNCV_2055561 [Trichonephila clavipes]|nr:hypothetical protein TNCV_2055561 [Trichonephila clavipes]
MKTTALKMSKFLVNVPMVRKFIKNYADLCGPFIPKRKLKKFIWSIEAKAFDVVKVVAITKAPVLKFPDFKKKPFELFTDASSIGVGAVLNQDQRPVVFASRTLSAVERNYTVTEREREGMFSSGLGFE